MDVGFGVRDAGAEAVCCCYVGSGARFLWSKYQKNALLAVSNRWLARSVFGGCSVFASGDVQLDLSQRDVSSGAVFHPELLTLAIG